MPLITLLIAALAAAAAAPAPAAASQCAARSAEVAARVVELYTSEGCNSCPPADAWLSSLKGRPDVVALAFHVDYWDRLGWKDRFADPAHTQRQAGLRRSGASSFVYTPQVVLDGRDWRGWRTGRIDRGEPARIAIELLRDGPRVTARIDAPKGTQRRLAGYWAGVEDGHTSAVRAGENAGATLHHDHVVRAYRALEPWTADTTRTLRFDSPTVGPEGRPRHVVLVVEDADTARPLQALALRC